MTGARIAIRMIMLYFSIAGFVGMFSLVLLWPGMLALHYANIEKFQLPDKTEIIFLVVNGLIGTVLSELMWLW